MYACTGCPRCTLGSHVQRGAGQLPTRSTHHHLLISTRGGGLLMYVVLLMYVMFVDVWCLRVYLFFCYFIVYLQHFKME